MARRVESPSLRLSMASDGAARTVTFFETPDGVFCRVAYSTSLKAVFGNS